MTTSIPLTDLPVTDQARRDQYGRYLVVPPTGGKPVPYTRVTTVAKALDDGGGLAPWKASMTAAGIIMRRGLRAEWEALLAQYGDPWYAGEGAKAACKKLVEECAAVGGANDRKEMGSSLHTITALVDLGRPPAHLTQETEKDIEAYLKVRAAHGIGIVPGQVELTVVLDKYQVAGTLDRLVTVPGFELPLIADLKTGGNLEYSWQSIAVQLAAYSRANAVYQQGPAKDGSADQRLPMPAVDQGSGLIFWLKAGTGEMELWLVNLWQGWEAFEHSMWARGWRKSTVAITLDKANEAITPQTDLADLLERSLAASETSKASSSTGSSPDKPEPEIDVDQQRAWLQARIDNIGRSPAAKADLLKGWGHLGLPSLKSSPAHTPAQLVAIEALLDDVERRHHLAVPPGPTHSIFDEEPF